MRDATILIVGAFATVQIVLCVLAWGRAINRSNSRDARFQAYAATISAVFLVGAVVILAAAP